MGLVNEAQRHRHPFMARGWGYFLAGARDPQPSHVQTQQPPFESGVVLDAEAREEPRLPALDVVRIEEAFRVIVHGQLEM